MDDQGVPSFPEVVSHYDVAIWYTGDDYAPTVPNGFITHLEEALEFRDFINYQDGKLFATGQVGFEGSLQKPRFFGELEVDKAVMDYQEWFAEPDYLALYAE